MYEEYICLKMSSNALDDWDDEEEEEDFVPEYYDDDEGDDYADNDEEEDTSEDFPSVLQGELFVDRIKGLCYEKDGVFCLVCKTSLPVLNFPSEVPVKESPLVFAGWINDPNNWMEFEVTFAEEPASQDPLQIQLLESQEQKQSYNRLSTATKTGNENINDDGMEKKSPAKGNLKAPPSYSLKEKIGIDDAQKCSSKDSATGEGQMGHQGFSKRTPTVQDDMVVVVSGSQIGNNGQDKSKIKFRGAYRCPPNASVERLHFICPVEILDGTSTQMAGATTAVAAASSKRDRSGGGDDDSVEGNVGVAYQELIDLHDDTRLSTEELRKRYYGSGDNNKGEYGKMDSADNKRLKGTDGKGYPKEDDEEDDDDDAYGF